MAGSARDEAERLVATILARAAASSLGAAAAGREAAGSRTPEGTNDAPLLGALGESVAGLLNSGSWSTGSAECCVCPVCKAIAAMRDPSPETAERIATSAGDIATGVAGLMRALSGLAGEQRSRPSAPRAEKAARTGPSRSDSAWAAATDRVAEDEPATPDPVDDPWAAATAESAREAAAAAKARAAAAEAAVERAVEQARAAAEASRRAAPRTAPVTRTQTGSDVWAMATAEAVADDAAAPRSVDHDLGASAPEDRDAAPGDGARAGDAV
jgi:hypothetical protein